MAECTLTYTVTVHDNDSDNEAVGSYIELLFRTFEDINELVSFGLESITSSTITYGEGESIDDA